MSRQLLSHRTLAVAAIGAGCVVTFAALVALFYFEGLHAFPGNSDKAMLFFQGQAIAHGNVLLKGWVVALDSYWTSDTLLSALGIAIVGVRPVLSNLEPAVVAALVTCAGMLVAADAAAKQGRARRAQSGPRGSRLVGAATVFILVALATTTFQLFLLSGGWHVSTALFALTAFVLVREGRFGLRWGLTVACLAVACLSDLDIIAYAVVPIVCSGIVAALRRRTWKAAIAPITAALTSTAAYEVCRSIVLALGGYRTVKASAVPSLHQVFENVKLALHYGGEMLGIVPAPRVASGLTPDTVARALAWSHLLVGALILAALGSVLWQTIRGLRRGGPMGLDIDEMLLFAVIGGAATFIVQSGHGQISDARYLVAAAFFAAVLTGRAAARCWPRLAALRAHRLAGVAALTLGLVFAGLVGDELASPVTPPTAQVLADWLEVHHLDAGIGDFWAASITTLDSGGRVVLLPVMAGPDGLISRIGAPIDSAWYHHQQFQFLVTKNPAWNNVTILTATRSFGRPAHVYRVGIYHVLVWDHPIAIPATAIRPATPTSLRPASPRSAIAGCRGRDSTLPACRSPL